MRKGAVTVLFTRACGVSKLRQGLLAEQSCVLHLLKVVGAPELAADFALDGPH